MVSLVMDWCRDLLWFTQSNSVFNNSSSLLDEPFIESCRHYMLSMLLGYSALLRFQGSIKKCKTFGAIQYHFSVTFLSGTSSPNIV